MEKFNLKDWKELLKRMDPKKMGLKKNYVVIIVGLLLVGLILARTVGMIQRVLFKKKASQEAGELELVGEVTPVKVYEAKKMAFQDTLPVMGTVKGYREVDLKFETNGVIESFNFEEGENIQEGDIIANLRQRDAMLKLKYAELELEKANRLFEAGGVDKVKLEQTKLEYESAKSDFEKTNIYASADGILGSRDIDEGTYVTPNDKIGVFVDISSVWAEFNIIERDSPKLSLGQKAEIYIDAYPNKSFQGMIDAISPIVEGRTRTQKVKIELKNPDFDLKPGMFTRALISTYEKDDALVIPTSAFKKKESDYFVFVVHKEEKPKEEDTETILETGVVEVRKIEIEYLTQDVAEIAKGVDEGDLIIVEAFQEFNDKDRVEISEVQESIF